MKRVLNDKGFTLIELLAVITIMGILMMVAIPAVSNTIYNSKKKTFANTANTYIKQVKTKLSSEELTYPEAGKSLIVPTSTIQLDSGGDSPFTKKAIQGYVKVTSLGNDKYEYSFAGVDDAKNGISDWVTDTDISNSKDYSFVKKNVTLKAKNCDSTKTTEYLVDGDGKTAAKISFTINGTTYTATEGQTFGEWIMVNGGSSTGNSLLWVTAAAGFTDQELATDSRFNGGVWSNYKYDTHANGLNYSLYMEIPSHYVNGKVVLPTERFCKWDGSSQVYMTYTTVIEKDGIYGGSEYLLYNFCCFDAGTKISMADGTLKNIEDVKEGDYVLSYNEKTKMYEPNKVVKEITKHNSDDLVYVNLSNGQRLGMRAYHPLLTKDGYKSLRPKLAETIMEAGYGVSKLEVGDELIGLNGDVRVVSIETRNPISNYDTYNLSVENNHNYIANGVVVHNAGCPT